MKKKGIWLTILSLLAAVISLFAVGCGNTSKDDGDDYIVVYFYGTSMEPWYDHIYEEEFSDVWFNPNTINDPDYVDIPSVKDFIVVPEGKKIQGWYTQKGVQYFDAQGNQIKSFTFNDDGLKIYLRFENSLYHVTLDYGSGYMNGDTMMGYSYTVDREIRSLPVPTPNDPSLEFEGWYYGRKAEGGKRITDENGQPLYATHEEAGMSGEVTLYAEYALQKRTVTLDYNDMTSEPIVLEVEYGTPMSEIDLDSYQKETEDKLISGWSSAPYMEAILPEYITEDITLYALWLNYKNVAFVYTANDIRTEKVLEVKGVSSVLPSPDRPGYAFEGWFESTLFSGLPLEKVPFFELKDTYYAKWSIAEYLLTFVDEGGEYFEPISYYYNDTTALPVPQEKEGYVFEGWVKSLLSAEKGMFNIPADMYGDKTLYAKWVPETYEILLDTQGGVLENDIVGIAYGSTYTLPVPAKTGYTFLGWYSTAEGDATRYTTSHGDGLKSWTDANGATMYARYTRTTHTVTYETNGGTAVEAQQYLHGKLFEFPEQPTKAGMIFGGWYSEDGATEYTESMTVREGVTLYAKWVENSVAISDADGLKAIKDDPAGTYHLTNDINLYGETWSPIAEFTGTLDGQGYKIFNFNMSSTSAQDYGFIKTNKGAVKNLSLEKLTLNVTVSAHNVDVDFYVGTLVGRNEGTISNCRVQETLLKCDFTVKLTTEYTSATKTCVVRLGGIVGYNGYNNRRSSVDSCYAATEIIGNVNNALEYIFQSGAVINGGIFAGGIAGQSYATIQNCVFEGSITTVADITGRPRQIHSNSWNIMGGIAGINTGGKCLNNVMKGTISGTVKNSVGKEDAMYVEYIAGGILGRNENGGVVGGCYSEGTISGKSTELIRLGGIVAENWSGSEIRDCYSYATVNQKGGTDRRAGGIVGSNESKVKTSYFGGTVNSNDGTSGGLAGGNGSTGTIMNCFTIGDVIYSTSAGTKGIFVGSNKGVINGSYYSTDSTFTANGSAVTPSAVTGVAGESEATLLSSNFIYKTLYFESDIWMIEDGKVMLYWQEIA